MVKPEFESKSFSPDCTFSYNDVLLTLVLTYLEDYNIVLNKGAFLLWDMVIIMYDGGLALEVQRQFIP